MCTLLLLARSISQELKTCQHWTPCYWNWPTHIPFQGLYATAGYPHFTQIICKAEKEWWDYLATSVPRRTKRSKGPNAEPCGTSEMTVQGGDFLPSTIMVCCRPRRKPTYHLPSWPLTKWFKFSNRNTNINFIEKLDKVQMDGINGLPACKHRCNPISTVYKLAETQLVSKAMLQMIKNFIMVHELNEMKVNHFVKSFHQVGCKDSGLVVFRVWMTSTLKDWDQCAPTHKWS